MEAEVLNPDLWDDSQKATEVNKELSEIKEEVDRIEKLKKDFNDLKEIIDLEDSSLESEAEKKLNDFEKKIEKEEVMAFLSGKYDKRNAVVEIFSGAGGQDAQDWVAILLRMYDKYLLSKNFKIEIIKQSLGEKGGPEGRIGVKEVSFEVKGKYAYGLLKSEKGVHRLVRLSPFSSSQTRHTSFALVDIFPEIKHSDDIKIKPEEIRVDNYKASGPGGQHVNKRETAVRITHIPTGLTGSSQSGRLQGKNKEKAMKILMAKLYRFNKEKNKKEIKKIKGESKSAEWGSQIRSYVLHPYKMVKDLRTGYETSNIENVLEGDLEDLIKKGIKINNK